MSDLIYLYGWIPGTGGARIEDLRGIADRPVELVPCGGALAVISRVPATGYGAEQIEARLSDMSWLGEHGLAHERVVAALVDQATVVPARLFTLFSGDAALATECTARGEWISHALERLDGLREWDLKVAYDATRMLETIGDSSAEVAALDRELAEASPGRRYLLQKQRDDVARGAVRKAVGRLGDEVLDDFATIAQDVKRVPPPSNAEPGELPVILAAALLVARDREDALREKLAAESQRLAARGVSVSCAGPWAAYRFIGS